MNSQTRLFTGNLVFKLSKNPSSTNKYVENVMSNTVTKGSNSDFSTCASF